MLGYRSLPIIKNNPQWWMVEILDGFGAHLNNLYANDKRAENKILSLKEEGDSSQVNQAYDKEAAKSDKRVQRINLNYLLHDRRLNCNIIDQWALCCCGLASVRHTARHPGIWEGSFIAVNIHPSKRVSFELWCKRIEKFMQASDGFDLVTQKDNALDEYTLLPSLWQAMLPQEKRGCSQGARSFTRSNHQYLEAQMVLSISSQTNKT